MLKRFKRNAKQLQTIEDLCEQVIGPVITVIVTYYYYSHYKII